jgi:hypothetical protein
LRLAPSYNSFGILNHIAIIHALSRRLGREFRPKGLCKPRFIMTKAYIAPVFYRMIDLQRNNDCYDAITYTTTQIDYSNYRILPHRQVLYIKLFGFFPIGSSQRRS